MTTDCKTPTKRDCQSLDSIVSLVNAMLVVLRHGLRCTDSRTAVQTLLELVSGLWTVSGSTNA